MMAITPFASRERAFCTRCQAHSLIERPWRGWVWLRRAWFGLAALVVCVSPILAADYVIMIPSAFMFFAAYGPLSTLASTRASCLSCGAIVDHKLRVASQHGNAT